MSVPISLSEQRRALRNAIEAAQTSGQLMRRHLASQKVIHSQTRHDIKLELDLHSQNLIEKRLRKGFPNFSFLGEEGAPRAADRDCRWVVDPIDGTVNFTHGIPHACVSIALQQRRPRMTDSSDASFETLLGVVYDPFLDELWTARRGARALLNGRPIHVSRHRRIGEAIVGMGFAKSRSTMSRALPAFNQLLPRARKIRLLGAAALSMTWVAAGRLDAYLEYGIHLWDIAAGGLILECAGGEFWRNEIGPGHTYEILANNGFLRRSIHAITRLGK